MLAETHMKFYKPSIIVGSFKGAGIFPVNRDAVSITSLKPSLTFLNSPVTSCKNNVRENLNSTEMQSNGFQIAFQTYNSTISTPVREKYEKRDAEGYDIEGVSPRYDVYKKLKRNLPIVNSLTDAHHSTMRSSDTDNKNPEGFYEYINGKEKSSLQVLADAAVCVLHNESFSSEASIVSTAESSTPQSSKQTSISPNLSSLILPPKTLSSKRKSIRGTKSLPDHMISPDLIRSMALNKLKVARQKAERELKAKTKYLSKFPVNKSYSQKSSTVKRNN